MPYKSRTFTCFGCSKEVTHNTIPTRKYCSHACYLKKWDGHTQECVCLVCSKTFTAPLARGEVKYCSRDCYFSVPVSEDSRKKRANPGEKHWNWKGGVMKGRKDRNLSVYKDWRYQVFKRDGFACVACGIKNHEGLGFSVQLEADHIMSWTDYPELRYEVSNGRTLCKDCHSKRTAQQHRERMRYVA